MWIPSVELMTVSSVALVAGMMSAMTGGSGMIVLPTLLMVGVPPHFALGTNKLFTACNLFTSAMTFMRKGLFNPRIWGMIILTTLLGAALGSLLVQLVSQVYLQKILPLMILGIAAYFLFSRSIRRNATATQPQGATRRNKSMIVGSLIGAYSGFFGAGTGSICAALAMSVFKLDMKQAAAMSRFLCFLANLVAVITFIVLDRVDYSLGISLVLLGPVGAYIGTKLALQSSNRLLRWLLVITSMVMGVILLIKAWY